MKCRVKTDYSCEYKTQQISIDYTTTVSNILKCDNFDRLNWLQILRCISLLNGTKSKLLSFNSHWESGLMPLKMISIDLPERSAFLLLDLVFTAVMNWRLLIQFIGWFSLSISPYSESIMCLYKSTFLPCMEYSSHFG